MIAMVLLRDPWLILCDEPTTALDVTIQKQILGLLLSLRKKTQVALVLVTHDLAVVAETCQTVVVMYAGRVVETGTVDRVFSEPRHPYTLGLLRSLPDIGLVADTLESIPGKPPDLANPPDGCRFHPRCRFREEDCVKGDFPLLPLSDGRTTACIHHEACATSHSPSRVGAHA
jgi:oligopeptide/dipeptide ABC transporter ATP-binding protein